MMKKIVILVGGLEGYCIIKRRKSGGEKNEFSFCVKTFIIACSITAIFIIICNKLDEI